MAIFLRIGAKIIMVDKKTFTPEAFGAVADGITNDSNAVNAAIQEAAKCGGTVQFAKDKEYFFDEPEGEGPVKAALTLINAKGVTLKGDNTVIKLGKSFRYFSVYCCNDIKIDGFIFERNPHVAFRGRLVSVCEATVSAVIKTDYEIPFEGDVFHYCDYENSVHPSSFAMPDDQWRNHLFLRSIQRNKNKNEYTVWFDNARLTRDGLRRVNYSHCDIIMPTPNFSHNCEGFFIGFSSNIFISNCNIKEASQFIGAIKANVGELFFENVKMCTEKDQTTPMVAWRDGYHCKDNRGAIHWKNCEIGRLYDDAFNISVTCLLIDEQPTANVLSLKCLENNGCYYNIKVGDELSVYDTFRGIPYCEAASVVEVIKQHGSELLVRLNVELPPVDKKHTRVMFDSLSAPGSTIEDCYVEGTVRMRGPITVKNTRFEKLLMMWTENETHIEGPVPHDMLFENCSFIGVYPVHNRYMDNYFSFRTVMEWPGIAQYKLKNIRLVNCEYDSKYLYIEEGNDVKILNADK